MTKFQEERQNIAKKFFFLTQRDEKISFAKIAVKVGKSVKQIRRLYKLWKNNDPSFFIHKNTNKPSTRKINTTKRKNIVNEYVSITNAMLAKWKDSKFFYTQHHMEFYERYEIKKKYNVTYPFVNTTHITYKMSQIISMCKISVIYNTFFLKHFISFFAKSFSLFFA